MSTPFIAEIKIISWNFPPKGWAFCNGQLLPINQNQALFSLLGTTYGGDGRTNFALPNLRGQVPIHMGGGHTLGEKAGQTAVTITQQTMPTHLHAMNASATIATLDNPAGNVLANGNPNNLYGPVQNLTTLNPATVSSIGGSQPHSNLMPYLVLNFIIALQGIFPSQT
jgi:microcystin-dependent protein